MNSDPVNEDADQGPAKRYLLEFVLGFLNFHRRTFLGLALLAGVGFLLFRLNNTTPVSEEDYVPTTTAINGDSQSELTPASRPMTESVTAEKVTPVEPPKPKTTDERVNELLETAANWSTLSNGDAIVFLEERLVGLRELLQAEDLKPRQREYCQLHFIDSVSLLSGMARNTGAGNGGIEGINELLGEVEQTYTESENPEIAAAANLVLVRYPALQFTESNTEENFEAFENAFQKRHSVILKSDRSAEQLTLLIDESIRFVPDDPRLRKIAVEHMSQVVDLKKPAATSLATKLFFSRVGLENLPDRVRSKELEVDTDVQLLVNQLEKHPDVPLEIYSILASSIARYQDNSEDEKAEKYIKQFKAIVPTIKTERIRDEVLKGIKQLETADSDS